MSILKFDDEEGKVVFWHSSAHVLGEVLEQTYGSYLTIGPPLNNGFYYDSFMGEGASIGEGDYANIESSYAACVKAKQPFERLVVTKEEALELFAYNPFKSQLIATKVLSRLSPSSCDLLLSLIRMYEHVCVCFFFKYV